jgi:alpha-D-ribose 1-methylphosphonate 5-triphosphate synthase subunit PhnH
MTAFVRESGFHDPVHDAQQVFRVLLTALSRPCRPWELPPQLPAAPAPLPAPCAAVLLTLCDGDTPLWLGHTYNTSEVRAWLRFHSGCPLVDDPGRAAFAVAASFAELPPLTAFPQGSPAYPDRSATILVGIPGLQDKSGPGTSFTAVGPGINESQLLDVPPSALPENFDRIWAANRGMYPLGVDMLLLAPEHVLGLPRTVQLSAC